MSRKRFIILTTLFVLTVAGLSFLISPFFTVRDYFVIGQNNLAEEKVEMVINSFLGQNIWIINTSTLENRLQDINYISRADVSRNYPDSLVIRIEERKPLAYIHNQGNGLVFSSQGYILEEINNPEEKELKLPLIKGLGYVFSGEQLIFHSRLEKVVDSLARLERGTRKRIKEISYEEEEFVLLMEPEIPVYMGDNNITEKFALFQSAVSQIERENMSVEYINLKVTSRPVIKEK